MSNKEKIEDLIDDIINLRSKTFKIMNYLKCNKVVNAFCEVCDINNKLLEIQHKIKELENNEKNS